MLGSVVKRLRGKSMIEIYGEARDMDECFRFPFLEGFIAAKVSYYLLEGLKS